MTNTRSGFLTAVKKAEEAASVADNIGGAEGASLRSKADYARANSLISLGDLAAAARAACSALRAARASGSRSDLVDALVGCGYVAKAAPGEMAKAERESRDLERSGSTPSHGGLDLSLEGLISLVAVPLPNGLAYTALAVFICDAALAVVGGHDTPAADDPLRVPNPRVEANARSSLGVSLCQIGSNARGVASMRQAVALWRMVIRDNPHHPPDRYLFASSLYNQAAFMKLSDPAEVAEAEACLREALALAEETDDVQLKQLVLAELANLSGQVGYQAVEPAEAEAFRSQMNQLLTQTGRSPDTTCTICLEPLERPGGSAEKGTASGAGGDADSAVRVMGCCHQFHEDCLVSWWRTLPRQYRPGHGPCPICKT